MKKFDEEVFGIAETDPFLIEFADIRHLNEKRYFIRTKLHEKLEGWLSTRIDYGQDGPSYISGIKGIGKSTSLLYIALQRLKRKQNDIHYIDLNCFEQESQLQKFEKFVCDFERKSMLIIDHAKLDNASLVEQIIKLVQHKRLRIVAMETGFTTSMQQTSFVLGKDYQLDQVEFCSIWNGTLERINQKFPEKGEDVYSYLAKKTVVTPRLLYFLLDGMSFGWTLGRAYSEHTRRMRNRIDQFVVREDNEKYSVFNLHTRILLHHVPPDGDHIIPLADLSYIRVAVNIFDVQVDRVTKDDLERDAIFKEFNFAEGDEYARISHLIPENAEHWRSKYPYSYEVLGRGDSHIYEIMFKSGGARREFEKFLVQYQIQRKSAIRPEFVRETNYEPSATYCDIDQASSWYLMISSPSNFYSMSPTREDISEIDTEFQGSERNVAKCAILMREEIKRQGYRVILLYPKIGNFMGISYFLYLPNVSSLQLPCEDPRPKKPKFQRELNLVQVCTGATHTGETIGKSLNVVKQVFSDTDIIIHVVIIVLRKDNHPYRLRKCKYENVSVINLATNMDAMFRPLSPGDSLLKKFINQLLNMPS